MNKPKVHKNNIELNAEFRQKLYKFTDAKCKLMVQVMNTDDEELKIKFSKILAAYNEFYSQVESTYNWD